MGSASVASSGTTRSASSIAPCARIERITSEERRDRAERGRTKTSPNKSCGIGSSFNVRRSALAHGRLDTERLGRFRKNGSPFCVRRTENRERRTENGPLFANDGRASAAASREEHDDQHENDERQDADRDPHGAAVPT